MRSSCDKETLKNNKMNQIERIKNIRKIFYIFSKFMIFIVNPPVGKFLERIYRVNKRKADSRSRVEE